MVKAVTPTAAVRTVTAILAGEVATGSSSSSRNNRDVMASARNHLGISSNKTGQTSGKMAAVSKSGT